MASNTKLQLPAIPSLKGKENIGQWKNIVIQTFRFHRMLKYLLQDSSQVNKTSKKKAFGIVIIMSSVSRVANFIEDAGWDFAEVDQDPKDLYDLILKLYHWRPDMEGCTADDWDPVDQFKSLAYYDGDSIEEFHRMVLDLRREMKRDETDLPDCEATEIVVQALEDLDVPQSYRLYKLLSPRLAAGDLTWKELMEQIASECAWGSD